MAIGTALRLVQSALSAIILVLFIGRYQGKWATPSWLRSTSASNVVWSIVVLAGVLVSATILLVR
jgi:hypothetical protein